MSTDDAIFSDLLYNAAVAQTNSMLIQAQANADGVVSASEQLAVNVAAAEAVDATVAAVRVAAAVVWRTAETVGVEVSSAAAVKEGPMRAAPNFAADCPPRCAPK